jgi:hypothetical protein
VVLRGDHLGAGDRGDLPRDLPPNGVRSAHHSRWRQSDRFR